MTAPKRRCSTKTSLAPAISGTYFMQAYVDFDELFLRNYIDSEKTERTILEMKFSIFMLARGFP